MAEFSGALGAIGESGTSALMTTVWVSIGIFVIAVVLLSAAFIINKKKKYNLIVEIKMPRSDSRIINAEHGIGSYDAKKGVVLIKRNKLKPVAMKIFDIKKYLQGSSLITVIQVGPEDFRPVLNDSWTVHDVEYEDETKPKLDAKGNQLVDEDGKKMYETTIIKESILNIKTESGHNKAWKAAWEEAAKQAYTIQSFLREYQAPIAIGVVVVCCFVGFAILWTKLSTVCG